MSDSRVKSFLFSNTRMAWTPRGDSALLFSTYAGKSAFFWLLGPAAVHGQLFTLYSHPLAGLSRCGDSSTVSRPFHSVAGSLPSTGFVQSNFGSRFGMKFAWKYAMLPLLSAKIVLFDEFV